MKIITMDQQPRDITIKFIIELDEATCMWDLPKWLAGARIYNFSDGYITRPLVDMVDTYEGYSAHLH